MHFFLVKRSREGIDVGLGMYTYTFYFFIQIYIYTYVYIYIRSHIYTHISYINIYTYVIGLITQYRSQLPVNIRNSAVGSGRILMRMPGTR